MKKQIFILLCVCMLSLLFPYSAFANQEKVEIFSEYAIVLNRNDHRIMYEKNANVKMYPASLTKMMSVLVAIEEIHDIKDTYIIEERVLDGLEEANASVAGFLANEKVTYEDLLYGIMLPSGADASRAIAFSLFDHEEGFVQKMNEKAQSLGMEHTHFVNTSGLHDENHYTTAYDMMILLDYALNNDLFKKIFTTKRYLTSNKRITLYSTFAYYDSILDFDTSMIVGSKTGFTNPASLCLASLAIHKGEEYIAITAQTHSDASYPYHVEDSVKLYNYFFDHYQRTEVIKKGKILASIPIVNGKEKSYEVKTPDVVSVLTKDKKSLEVKWKGQSEIIAPDYSDTYIGTLMIYEEDMCIYSEDYHLSYNVENRTSFVNLNIIFYLYLGFLFLLPSLVRIYKKKNHK